MSKTEVIDQRPLTQAAPIRTVNEDERTVEVVFTTGADVPHWMNTAEGFRQVMTRARLTEAAARLERLNAGAPVLDGHMDFQARDVIGVVESARIEEGQRGVALIRFSQAEEVEPIWQKVREGTLRNVSMGFYVHEALIQSLDVDGEMREIWELTDWEPFEISMVAIGADPGARVQGGAGKRPATVIDSRKEIGMSKNTQAPAGQQPGEGGAAPAVTQGAQGGTTATPAFDENAVRQQAARDERARVTAIRQAGTALKLDEQVIQKAIDDGTEVDTFRQSAIEAFAARGGDPVTTAPEPARATQGAGIGGPRASVTADAGDRFRQGAMLGLMARGGLDGGERNEFTGMTLAELARQSLSIANVSQAFSRRTEMIGAAFVQSAGGHSTSDFANVLADITGKAALIGWEEAEETFQAFTSTGTLTDFKPSKRVGTGVFSSLLEKTEGAEYKQGTMGDRGESITLATYGRMLKITREAIINDDLSLLTDAPRKMGRAARRTIGNLVYAVLTGNPTMSDGTALFHADHGNLAGSGGAPSVTTLGAARAAMRTQKEGDASALNIAPAHFIVPAALETLATQLMRSTFEPTANKGHATNPVAGMAEVIVDGRLDANSATAWYLAASPAMHDTIEVAYLDGVQEPFIEQKEAWSTDGAELKVRIDAGVAPLDYRSLYKNAGT